MYCRLLVNEIQKCQNWVQVLWPWLSFGRGKFIQKVAEGKSPVWKYFSLSLVVDKESEEYQGHVVCKNCENIFKHVYVYSKYYNTWFNRYWS